MAALWQRRPPLANNAHQTSRVVCTYIYVYVYMHVYVQSYQWGFVVAVKDVDEVSDRQHTC